VGVNSACSARAASTPLASQKPTPASATARATAASISRRAGSSRAAAPLSL
jgi:hypothetical protein